MTQSSALRAQREPAATCRDPRLEVQPFLLDRLTNHRQQTVSATDETDAATRVSVRESILRDLSWLMNCTSLEATDDLDAYPHVRRSVLNFGMSVLTGKQTLATDLTAIESAFREAIVQFEPRIIDESIEVRCIAEPTATQQRHALSLEISGQWWSTLSPQTFLLQADVDLESGHVALRLRGNR